jgi:hypothetical protein
MEESALSSSSREAEPDHACLAVRAICKFKPKDFNFLACFVVRGLSVIQSSISLHSAKRMMLGRSHFVLSARRIFRFALARFAFSRFTRSWSLGVEVLRAARSLSDAYEFLSISWDQAHRIMERAVARGLERRSLEELSAVGIDEKSFLSGQSYVSVLSDPKGSRVLEVTEGRERASAERLFESLGLEQRHKVEAVVMDMSAASEAAAEAKMPQAEIVHDRFPRLQTSQRSGR